MIKELTIAHLQDVFDVVCSLAEETEFYEPEYKTFLVSWVNFIQSGVGVIFGRCKDRVINGIISGIATEDSNTGIMTASECHLYVKPDLRKRGIAGELYKEFEQWAREEECKLITMAHPYKSEWMTKIFQGFRPLETHYIKEI
jgi:GNAT superfamily N-acetyltransferase